MRDKKLGLLSHCDGGTSAEPHCLLAEVYQLLNGYAPVWYSEDLQCRLQAALRPLEGIGQGFVLSSSARAENGGSPRPRQICHALASPNL